MSVASLTAPKRPARSPLASPEPVLLNVRPVIVWPLPWKVPVNGAESLPMGVQPPSRAERSMSAPRATSLARSFWRSASCAAVETSLEKRAVAVRKLSRTTVVVAAAGFA